MPLNPNHDFMKSRGYDRETLELIEKTMALNLSPERQAAIRAEEQQRQQKAIRDELDGLKALADRVEAGAYGPEGKEIARRLLAGGRTDSNLRELRDTIKRLR